MPIALDGDTVDVYLESDKDKPEATRPAFVCRYLTSKQLREYRKALKTYAAAIDERKDDEIVCGMAMQTLSMVITDTKNLPDKPLDELLSDGEMWELALAIPNTVSLSELDKKKSRVQSPLAGENSEPPAAPMDAATVPANTPPNS
jgi:hypothetical protein